jgi:small subunit ribosomal protein S14
MAKTSMVNRDIKREKLAKKYAEKRAALKKIVSSVDATYEEKIDAATKLAKLPRDSSPSRQRNRCELSGRPRGVYSKFGLGRNKLREATMRGDVRACARPAGNQQPRGFLNRAGRRSASRRKKPKSPAQAALFGVYSRVLPCANGVVERSGPLQQGPGPFPGDNRFSRKRISVHSKVLI